MLTPFLSVSKIFPPHRPNASPVKRCSSFVVSKQSCQTIAAAAIKNVYYTFKVLLHLQCSSGAPLCFAVCHAACSSSSFLTAATVSFTPLRSFLPLFRFITPRSQLNHLLQGWAFLQPDTMQCTKECTNLSQTNATILTGFHSASLRHTFTSVAFSPPAAFFSFARRQPHLGCVHLAAANCSCRPPFRKASLRFTCIVQPPPYPDGKFTPAASYGAGISLLKSAFTASPFVGARCPPPFIRSSFSPAATERLANTSAPTSLRGGYAFFFCRRRIYRQA